MFCMVISCISYKYWHCNGKSFKLKKSLYSPKEKLDCFYFINAVLGRAVTSMHVKKKRREAGL